MAAKPLPSQEVLRQLLRYEPETGKLFWKERGPGWFQNGRHSAEHNAGVWNARYANGEAFLSPSADGYYRGAIFNVFYRSHRIIWKMVTGTDPIEIDHINGIRTDNRWVNLRSVEGSVNMKNSQTYATNSSGRVGVGWFKARNKWRAQIFVAGRARHLGFFDSFDDAVAARVSAEIEHGYHENHGRTPTTA